MHTSAIRHWQLTNFRPAQHADACTSAATDGAKLTPPGLDDTVTALLHELHSVQRRNDELISYAMDKDRENDILRREVERQAGRVRFVVVSAVVGVILAAANYSLGGSTRCGV